jgi:hypothetical protein
VWCVLGRKLERGIRRISGCKSWESNRLAAAFRALHEVRSAVDLKPSVGGEDNRYVAADFGATSVHVVNS